MPPQPEGSLQTKRFIVILQDKLRNTNNEVFKLEKKLDQLFEKNRQLFLNFENGL